MKAGVSKGYAVFGVAPGRMEHIPVGDRLGEAMVLFMNNSPKDFRKSIALFKECGNDYQLAKSYRSFELYLKSDKLDEALSMFQKVVAIFEMIGNHTEVRLINKYI